MTERVQNIAEADAYRTAFNHRPQSADDGVWIGALRAQALEQFLKHGFPAAHEEDWRYTDLSPVAERAPAYLQADTEPKGSAGTTTRTLQIDDAITMPFVDGHYAGDVGTIGDLPAGVRINTLRNAFTNRPETLERYLGHIADIKEFKLAALNTAFLSDGVVLEVEDGCELDRPLHVSFATTRGNISVQPRLLIKLGKHSRAVVVEHHFSQGSSISNGVTEAHCGAGAQLDYYKCQQEHQTAYHLSGQHFRLGQHSRLRSMNLDLGGAICRNDLRIDLAGDGAEATLSGLFIADSRSHVDNHTVLDHTSPHTTSNEDYRGVLADGSHAVFNGKIIVRPGAVKTDANLTNRNLLLGRQAEIDTKPELEIYADDVKCSHGSTTGQLDANALFYLLTRGISRPQAENMLVAGFASGILTRISIAELREWVQRAVDQRLTPTGEDQS